MSVYHVVVLPSIFVIGPVLMQQELDGARSWAVIVACFGVGNVLGDLLFWWWRPRFAPGWRACCWWGRPARPRW